MNMQSLSGEVLDEQIEITLSELCRACNTHAEWVIELVEEGILTPVGVRRSQWRFSGMSITVAHRAKRLQTDLGLNLAGIALALELLEEIDELRSTVDRLSDTN